MMSERVNLLDSTLASSQTRRAIYLIMVMFGLTSLLPWNIIITAHGYYEVKLNQTRHVPISISEHFPSYFQIVGIGSHFVLSMTAVTFLRPSNLCISIFTTNTAILLIFIVTSLLAAINTSQWPIIFFGTSLALFGASLALSAVYMSAMMGLCVILTPNGVQGFYLGQGVAGLFAACLSLITLSIPHADPCTAGIYYFLITATWLALSLLGFYLFRRNEFVQRCVTTAIGQQSALQSKEKVGMSTVAIFKTVMKYCFVTTMTSAITSSCFPAALSTLVSTNPSQGSLWVSTFFLPVVVFLLFALGDVLGRVTSSLVLTPSSKYLLPVAVLRLFLIPLVYTCNLEPRGSWLPVIFHNDTAPALFTLLLSWSNGHVQSLAAYYAPLCLSVHRDKATVSTLVAFSYSLGLLSGSVTVFFLSFLLNIE